MKIVWDEPKRLANLEKHGLDFAMLDETFFLDAVIRTAKTGRFMGIGVFADGLVVEVFSLLGAEAVSIISMRPANRGERSLFSDKT